MAKERRELLYFADGPESHTIEAYESKGGYTALRKALLEMDPDDIIEEIKRSGLKGRGGAAFPTGRKWSFIPKDHPGPKYVVDNADEGEPGTFKDRELLYKTPHLVLEGMILAGRAIGAREGYMYLRYEYLWIFPRIKRAIQEAYRRGYLGKNILKSGFDFDIYVYLGAGAYIAGYAVSTLESLEGKRPYPRLKPPRTSQVGLYGSPTAVNNVETHANVPLIISKGADWYSQMGTPESRGTRLFSISGAVERPGVYEFELGSLTLREFIYEVAGVPKGTEILGVFPGGLSSEILTPDELDVPMTHEGLKRVGSTLGSGAVIVLDRSTSALKILRRSIEFFSYESCGKCTPCRDGGNWMTRVLASAERRGYLTAEDVSLLKEITGMMRGKSFCPLGDSVEMVARVFLNKYKDELTQKPVAV
ncbi:MAG: NADH-quinone oxidoreductase subunit NuoF [Thermotogae bacterium]|nr:NADH-quinone oxidoreductase subunit NuoF [Thermotogota bacterium]